MYVLWFFDVVVMTVVIGEAFSTYVGRPTVPLENAAWLLKVRVYTHLLTKSTRRRGILQLGALYQSSPFSPLSKSIFYILNIRLDGRRIDCRSCTYSFFFVIFSYVICPKANGSCDRKFDAAVNSKFRRENTLHARAYARCRWYLKILQKGIYCPRGGSHTKS